jgi:exopolyphosphatase/guanosine-5'-triphosphate,3'-diphosphate pyrophosphatase
MGGDATTTAGGKQSAGCGTGITAGGTSVGGDATTTAGGTSVRVAGIDCGTNSLRLLIADWLPAERKLRPVERLMRIVRLGQGVDATGKLDPAAIERSLVVLRQYAELCQAAAVTNIRMVATSAVRDAANAAQFTEQAQAIIGVCPEVVDGLTEASLSFSGATSHLAGDHPSLVCDIGGGSTELVLGNSATPLAAYSMNVGCVRLTERCLTSDPATFDELVAGRQMIAQQLDLAQQTVNLAATKRLIGVAGTITSLAAYAIGLRQYDPARIDGLSLPIEQMRQACQQMIAMTRQERLALGFLPPGRADVLGGGALVWLAVLERVSQATAEQGRGITSVLVSEHDILDGITQSAVPAGTI